MAWRRRGLIEWNERGNKCRKLYNTTKRPPTQFSSLFLTLSPLSLSWNGFFRSVPGKGRLGEAKTRIAADVTPGRVHGLHAVNERSNVDRRGTLSLSFKRTLMPFSLGIFHPLGDFLSLCLSVRVSTHVSISLTCSFFFLLSEPLRP